MLKRMGRRHGLSEQKQSRDKPAQYPVAINRHGPSIDKA